MRVEEALTLIPDLNKTYTIIELMEIWDCSRDCARYRIFAAKKSGSKLKATYKCEGGNKKKRHIKKFSYVPKWNLGNKFLPACKRCEINGMTSEDGEKVHLCSDGKYTYCPNCGYEPGYDEEHCVPYKNIPQKNASLIKRYLGF